MTKASAMTEQATAREKAQNSALVRGYIPIAKFMAQVCGPNCEVVLHDLSNMESSIVCIENSHVTGRGEGGSITDFALRIVFDPRYRDRDFFANYPGRAEASDAILCSSTFYIRNTKGEIAGLLCTNVDVTQKRNFLRLLEQEVNMIGESAPGGEDDAEGLTAEATEEQFNLSLTSMVEAAFQKVMEEGSHHDARHMLADEKREVVAQLDARRIFMLRGSVSKVAKLLCISDPTLYRYLREARENRNES